MRARKKKNTLPRLKKCADYLVERIVPEAGKSLYIEIGCGKGKFITSLAESRPDVLFYAIEKVPDVLVMAAEKAKAKGLGNLKFIISDADALPEICPTGAVDGIYLNFSDPWPKDRHAKRRLPSKEFLARYDRILKKEGRLEFKTDNRDLFDFALEELPLAGWEAEKVTFDLHHDGEMNRGNIMTEYEERFSALGNPICKYIIYRKK